MQAEKLAKPDAGARNIRNKAGARSPKLRTFARAPLRGALAYVENLRDKYRAAAAGWGNCT